MQPSRNSPLVIALFIFVGGCAGSPTSPSSAPSPAASLPESLEMISATVPAGAMLKMEPNCVLNWDRGYRELGMCFEDLRLTFAVRSNRPATDAQLLTEFRRSDGRVCGETFMDTNQPIVAGVVATFQAGPVFLKPDCFDQLPLQTVTVLARVMAVSPGILLELMRQEFSINYTFAR